jgi:hypothetical protein
MILVMALLAVYCVQCAIDHKFAVRLVLLDLSSAFDTIDNNILTSLLKNHLGIGGTVLQWFMSYLADRKQYVSINDVKSILHILLYGVPQGSVLGPILFCIYILFLGRIIRKFGLLFHVYADDTQIYLSFDASKLSCAQAALSRLTSCVAEIHSWMTSNKLKLNEDKTEFLVFSSPHFQKALHQLSLKVGNVTVYPVTSARNLGVVFDNILNMDTHVTAISRSAHFHLRNIGAIRQYLTLESTVQLVHAFITSRLDYCNSLLYGVSEKSLKKLKRIQNTAARIVTRTRKYDNITPILKSLHWLPVHLRIVFKILLLTFRIQNRCAPSYLSDLLQDYITERTLRSSSQHLLFVPKSRTVRYGDRAFSVVAPNIWNNLPEHIRGATTVNTFKSHLKTYLFNQF